MPLTVVENVTFFANPKGDRNNVFTPCRRPSMDATSTLEEGVLKLVSGMHVTQATLSLAPRAAPA